MFVRVDNMSGHTAAATTPTTDANQPVDKTTSNEREWDVIRTAMPACEISGIPDNATLYLALKHRTHTAFTTVYLGKEDSKGYVDRDWDGEEREVTEFETASEAVAYAHEIKTER